MPLVRTQDEIVARISEVQVQDVFGFMREVLITNLDYDHAKPYLKEGVDEHEWDFSRTWNPDREAEEYLAFAITKIQNHRGISASRSVQKLSTWAWLLGRDDIVTFMENEDNYAQYGAPAVKHFATEMGFAWPKDDETLERMAVGLPCEDGCMSGCGLLQMWLKDGSLQCDGCLARFDYPGPRAIMISAARAHGWHIFRGLSVTGKELDKALCEDCVGTSRTRGPRAPRFDEEMPLF